MHCIVYSTECGIHMGGIVDCGCNNSCNCPLTIKLVVKVTFMSKLMETKSNTQKTVHITQIQLSCTSFDWSICFDNFEREKKTKRKEIFWFCHLLLIIKRKIFHIIKSVIVRSTLVQLLSQLLVVGPIDILRQQ